MDIVETDLPGVGKKYQVDLPDGTTLVIVIHNTGKREVFTRETPDADSEKLFELSDRAARTVGSILEGAYFQPVRSDRVETMLGDDTLLEWYAVDPDSPLAGTTLGDAEIGRKTGVTVVAIQRGDEVFPSPRADRTITAGDTLIVVGDREGCNAFERLLSGDR